ncbi:MAG: hypothetical protein IJR12_07335 [Bacteroidales bacterium]|nr:hypothetical protein [Bacteroidales bacterium]
MRKSIWTVLFTALVALVAVSCAKETDLTDVKNKINELDQRVTALEQAVEKINKETVPGFENLVKALNEKLTVVSVVESEDGVVINFSDGTSSTITNGKDGKDGADGKDGENGKDGVDGKDGENGKDAQAPEINITLIDGVYYWTVNGELLKDGDGNPIPVSTPGPQGDKGDKGDKGDQGEQGITPLFGTSSEGKVIVSYDNGETWKPLGFSVIDGSAFTSAYIDDNKSTDDYIVLVVGETEVQIPKEKNFSLVIKYEGDLSAVGANAGDNIAIEYEVEGASEADKVTVDVLSATAGITATIQKVDALHGYILIGVPAAEPEAEPAKVSGKIFVFADNNKGKTNIKVISLEEGEISAVADVSAQVPAAGGEIPLTVTTNKEYNVNISDGAETWLHVVDTKATHVDELNIVADPNTTGAYRVGVVSINDRATGELIEEFTVLQQPASDVATDLGSIRSLADDTAVAGQKAIVLASSKNGALVGDANGGYIFLAIEDNTAVRGDEVSFAGVKKTAEATEVKYVETSSITVTASAQEVPDLPVLPLRSHLSGNSLNTGVSGLLQKNGDVYYVDVQEYVYYFPNVIIEPTLGLDLEPLVDKYVTVKGYTNGSYVDYDENYDFTADSYVDFIALSATEVTFEANPNWTLSFNTVNGVDIITNTVSGGNDYWFNYSLNVYSAEDAAEFESLEALARYDCFTIAELTQYWYQRYGDTIDDDATTETADVELGKKLDYGDYVVVAVGLNEDGFVSGKYAVLEFTKVDPHIALDYDDFLGQWNFGKSVISITQKDADESYYITGFNGQEDAWAVEALFNEGRLVLNEQMVSEVDETAVYLSGIFLSKYISYPSGNSSGPDVLFTVAGLPDGTLEVLGGSNTKYGYAFDGFLFVTYTSGSLSGNTTLISMPTEITVYDPNAEPADPLQAEYTDEDYVDAIDKDELISTAWSIYCRPRNTDGSFVEERGWYSNSVVKDVENNAAGDDLITISGFSLGNIDDDASDFEFYDGVVYKLGQTNPWAFDLSGTTYYLKLCQFSTDANYYWTGNYSSYAIKVADGILAFIGNSSDYNINGFGLYAWSDEACSTAAGWLLRYKDVILVDPAKYSTSAAVSAALKNVNPFAVAAAMGRAESLAREKVNAQLNSVKYSSEVYNGPSNTPKEKFAR